MKRFLLLPGMLSAVAFNDLLAAPPSYMQTKDGVIPSKDNLTLKTKKLTAVIDLKTGAVTFLDFKGRILAEKQPLGSRFQPVVFEGKVKL